MKARRPRCIMCVRLSSGLAELTQKQQEAEGEPELPSVSDDVACVSEVPSQTEREHDQRDDGSDASGSQGVRAAGRLLRSAIVSDGIVHDGAS